MECNLSDEEVEEDYTDWEKHLDMEKSDCEPKALQQGSLKVGIKGDMSREEASMDNTEVLGELQREENKHVEVIKGKDGDPVSLLCLEQKVTQVLQILHHCLTFR